jgi:hypothetical protein
VAVSEIAQISKQIRTDLTFVRRDRIDIDKRTSEFKKIHFSILWNGETKEGKNREG